MHQRTQWGGALERGGDEEGGGRKEGRTYRTTKTLERSRMVVGHVKMTFLHVLIGYLYYSSLPFMLGFIGCTCESLCTQLLL